MFLGDSLLQRTRRTAAHLCLLRTRPNTSAGAALADPAPQDRLREISAKSLDEALRAGYKPAMSWLTNFVLPKIRAVVARKAVPDNLWHKCPGCEQMLFYRELEANFHVCRNCGHHLRIGTALRLKLLFDDGVFTRIELPKTVVDPLKFRDRKRYTDRL